MTLDQFKDLVGELARPFAIIATSLAASVATVIVACRVSDGNDGAAFMGAVGLMVGGIYVGKAWEVSRIAKAQAQQPEG